jgi:hypothetical protein
VRGEEGYGEQRGKMAQTMYAHTNKWIKKKTKQVGTFQERKDLQSRIHTYPPHKREKNLVNKKKDAKLDIRILATTKSRGSVEDSLKSVLKGIWQFNKMDKFLGM